MGDAGDMDDSNIGDDDEEEDSDTSQLSIPYPDKSRSDLLRKWREGLLEAVDLGSAPSGTGKVYGDQAEHLLAAVRESRNRQRGRRRAGDDEDGHEDVAAAAVAHSKWASTFGVDFMIECAEKGMRDALSRLYLEWSGRVRVALRHLRQFEGVDLDVSRALHAMRVLSLLAVFAPHAILPPGVLRRYLDDGDSGGLGSVPIPPSLSGVAQRVIDALSDFSMKQVLHAPLASSDTTAARAFPGAGAAGRAWGTGLKAQVDFRGVQLEEALKVSGAGTDSKSLTTFAPLGGFDSRSSRDVILEALKRVRSGFTDPDLGEVLVELPRGGVTLRHPLLAQIVLQQLLLPPEEARSESFTELGWPPALPWLVLDFMLNWVHRVCTRRGSDVQEVLRPVQELLITRVETVLGGHRDKFSRLIMALLPEESRASSNGMIGDVVGGVEPIPTPSTVLEDVNVVEEESADFFRCATPMSQRGTELLLRRVMDKYLPSPLLRLQAMRRGAGPGYLSSGCLLLVAAEVVCRDAFADIHLLRFIQRDHRGVDAKLSSAVAKTLHVLEARASEPPGFRLPEVPQTPTEAHKLKSTLLHTYEPRELEIGWDDWIVVASLAGRLRREGARVDEKRKVNSRSQAYDQAGQMWKWYLCWYLQNARNMYALAIDRAISDGASSFPDFLADEWAFACRASEIKPSDEYRWVKYPADAPSR